MRNPGVSQLEDARKELLKDLDFGFFKETLFFLVYILSLGVFLALKGKILLKE